jgi:hypothetical protein
MGSIAMDKIGNIGARGIRQQRLGLPSIRLPDEKSAIR